MKNTTRVAAATSALAVLLPLGAFPAFAVAEPGDEIQIFNITDFHGRISGGIGYDLAGAVADLKQPNSIFLSAGDNIGASTYASSSQQDNPTIDFLNAVGVRGTAVGNHEFDRGFNDLTNRVMQRADYTLLGANVVKKGTTDPALPAYTTYMVGDIKVGVIGVVTKDTASLVSPDGIADIEFIDTLEAVNDAAQELEETQHPDLTVLEAHTGPAVTDTIENAVASNEEFGNLVTGADPSIDAMFFGHSHHAMNLEAPIEGTDRTRPVVQAGNYGEYLADLRLVSEGDGDWSVKSSDLVEIEGMGTERNEDGDIVGVKDNVSDDVQTIITDAEANAQEVGSVEAGSITDDITRAFDDAGEEDRGAESTLGNLVADVLKEGVTYTNLEPADFGITNPGGLRTDLLMSDQFGDEAEGVVTDGELNQVLPFANDHGVVTMSGEDVIQLFAEQWQPEDASRPFLHLGISKELDVVYDSSAEDPAKRIVSVTVNGAPIDPAAQYRVATLSFLASGGDNFSAFANGTWEQSGMTDFEVWQQYFEENSPVSPDTKERQADRALDIINNGQATATVVTPDVTKNNFYLEIESKEAAQNLLFTVTPPQGMSVVWDDDVTTVEGNDNTVLIAEVPAGTTEVNFHLELNGEEVDDATTFAATLMADPAAQWWDNNPLPLPYTEDVAFVPGASGDGVASTEEPTSDDVANDDAANDDAASDDAAQNGDMAEDGGNVDNGSAADGKPLPRTGTETIGMIAAGLALLAVGVVAVVLTRSRRN